VRTTSRFYRFASVMASFTSVNSLFLRCRPPAIARLVIEIAVDSIERPISWALAHIIKKVLKAFPSLADFYPSGPVVLETIALGIRAALNHGGPRKICPAPGLTVSDASPSRSHASAALDSSTPEFSADHGFLSTAIASAYPFGWVGRGFRNFLDSRKHSEFFARLYAFIHEEKSTIENSNGKVLGHLRLASFYHLYLPHSSSITLVSHLLAECYSLIRLVLQHLRRATRIPLA
jgi:hypothetical protein